MNTINNIAIVFGTVFCLFALPFVAAHVQETWDAPEYPYTGFTPDCPVHYENSLPLVAEDSEEAR